MTKQLITISDNAAKRIKEILSNAESGVKGVRVSVEEDVEGGSYRDWETDRKSTRLNSSHRL